ncbi:exported hypothetical protein [Gammaproteobacteria bacterium]
MKKIFLALLAVLLFAGAAGAGFKGRAGGGSAILDISSAPVSSVKINTHGHYYDYGKNWEYVLSLSTEELQGFATSTDEAVQAIITYGGPTYVSTDTGKTWFISDTRGTSYDLAMSNDGRVQARSDIDSAGGIWVSTNTGQSWNLKYVQSGIYGLAMSRGGSVIGGVNQNGDIFVSTNTGLSWTQPFSIPGGGDRGKGVAFSYDGSVQLYTTDDMGIYISTDTGKTFTQKTFPDIHFTSRGASISNDGSIMIIADESQQTGGDLYVSTDTGKSWNVRLTNTSWLGSSMSPDGKIMFACSAAIVHVSTDTGISWSTNTLSGIAYMSYMAPDTSYIYVVLGNGVVRSRTPYASDTLLLNPSGGTVIIGNSRYNDSNAIIAGTLTTEDLVVSSTITANAYRYGDGTVLTTTATIAEAVPGGYVKRSGDSMSGKLILSSFTAVNAEIGDDDLNSLSIYTSTSGLNLQAGKEPSILGSWSDVGYNHNWTSLAISSNGVRQILTESGGHIWQSSDSGLTWTQSQSFSFICGAAMSSSGQYITLATDGATYISSNYGASWADTDWISNPLSAAMSADGSKQIATFSAYYSAKLSTDHGATWSNYGEAGVHFFNVAASSSCSTVVFTGESGQISITTDGGATWNSRGPSRSWTRFHGIAMSADGSVQVASVGGGPQGTGYVYVSTDNWTTWGERAVSQSWTSVCISKDGTKMMATCTDGLIYYSNDTGMTWSTFGSEQLWSSSAMSSDGSIRTAVASSGDKYSPVSGHIFTYQEATVGGYEILNLNPQGGGVSVGGSIGITDNFTIDADVWHIKNGLIVGKN